MSEKRGVIAGIILVVLIASVNIYLYNNENISNNRSISGMAVGEVPSMFSGLSFNKIAFIVQWFLLVIFLVILYVRHLKKGKEEKVKVSYTALKSSKGKSKTDMDLFYSLLKEKKHLKIDVISRIFGVDRERALEWAKVLENSNLAIINYPAFSEPEIELNEPKEEKHEKPEEKAEKGEKVVEVKVEGNEKEDKKMEEIGEKAKVGSQSISDRFKARFRETALEKRIKKKIGKRQ